MKKYNKNFKLNFFHSFRVNFVFLSSLSIPFSGAMAQRLKLLVAQFFGCVCVCVYRDGDDGRMVYPRIPLRASFRSLIVPKTKSPTLFYSVSSFFLVPVHFHFISHHHSNLPILLVCLHHHTTAFSNF